MKATLYEALGIPQAASDEEVRASLRRLIRKYYAKTRDGQGNVEEALRFINHASRILSDSDRRARYDNELALSTGSTEQRIAHVVTHAVAESGEQRTDVGTRPVDAAVAKEEDDDVLDDELEAALAGETRARAQPAPPGPHRARRDVRALADRHARAVRAVRRVHRGGHRVRHAERRGARREAGARVADAGPPRPDRRLRRGARARVAVRGARRRRRRRCSRRPTSRSSTGGREKSVFLGTNQPQEDASWIFQLRMAELERAKSGRTSEPRPWQRLGARLFDYAIWGLVLALLLSELKGAGAVPDTIVYWLGHPLVGPDGHHRDLGADRGAPDRVAGDDAGQVAVRRLPAVLDLDAYARRDSRTQFERGLKRAFRVWWEGLGCGFPLLAPFLIAVAYEKVTVHQETDWDFAYDCLVTHGPPACST
jgi:curved DNA-binding protein CbpA